jgi:hypothetical protein
VRFGKPHDGSQHSVLQVIRWQDVVVIVDDGRASAADYDILKAAAAALGTESELGGLTIIPKGSKPPSEEARRAVRAHLGAAKPGCFCWCVEAAGLEGATARAVLSGFRLFTQHKYPTHICASLEDALRWMLPLLRKQPVADDVVHAAAAHIREQRALKASESAGTGGAQLL